MTRWSLRLLLAGGLAVAACWLWRACFPNPEQVIRQRLGELCTAASFGPHEAPLAALAKLNTLAGLFTGDAQVKIDVGGFAQAFSGRERLLELARSARSVVPSLKVEFPDINVAVAPDQQSAEVDLTAKGTVPAEIDPQIYELNFTWTKIGGEWLIRRVETVKTLP